MDLVGTFTLLVISLVSAVCGQQCYPDESSTCIPAAQNVAYRSGKTTVSATSTCGSPPSRYCRIRPLNGCKTCNASSPLSLYNHNEKYMNDPRNGLTTWWQSQTWWDWYNTNQNDPLQVNATLSFNKSFDIMGEVRIIFESPRPFAMVLEKSTDKGQSWVPLQYYANNCQDRFGMDSSLTDKRMDENFNAVCTQEYSHISPQRNGPVLFDFSKRYTKDNFWNENVQNYLWATDIRIRMLYPGTTGLEGTNTEANLNQLYYAISDITIASRCKCNGHARWCDYPNLTGKNCDCYHNTAGDDCERCKLLYNNKPWRAATSESQPNPCEKCECNSHAEACVYNQTLNHGICQDCQHNTTGFFCEQCKDKFYRNSGTTHHNPHTCLSCGCFPYGITNNGSCNVTTGQCECRQNVTGRQCDQCKDTFWGYRLEPVGHCRQCLCTQSGTNGSLSCSQNDGQCHCKSNIYQRQCTTCRDGYYDFPTEVGTSADCKQCDCDYGGSVQEICEKVNGTCLCRKNITGKRCTGVEQGYFVGFFTLLKYEAEYAVGNGIQTSYLQGFGSIFTGGGYSKLSHHQWVTFPVKLSVTFPFHAVLRYTSPQSSNGSMQLHITAARTTNCTAVNMTHLLSPLTRGNGLAWKIQSPIGICKDQEFIFNVTFVGEGSNSTVEIDSLLLIPDITQVRTYQIVQQSPNTLGYTLSTMEACVDNSTTLTGTLSSLQICKNISFSVMAEAFNGALACKCNSTGTVSGTMCDPYGGQCQCKPGVTGRSCDQCKPGYFGFSQEGCKRCNCSDLGSDHLVCDVNTGQCPCKANVITRTCSRCNDSFYGFASGKGCVDCKCNASGSAHMQCDGDSGKCQCKSSTTGDKCDRCKQNFFNFTSAGCQACNCHEGGSRSLQCDLQSGVCSCKNNTVGMKCSSCVSETYNIDVNNPDGCAPCYCYGRSNICSSARFFTRSNITTIVHFNGNGNWILTQGASNTSVLGMKEDNGVQVNYNAGNSRIWVVFTAPSDPFSKDLLASYGQQLVLEIEYKTNPNINWTVELEPAVGSKVHFPVVPKPSQVVTTYNVRLHEDLATETLSAYQLQSKLANVKRVRIRVEASGQGEFWFKSMSVETAQQSIVALDTVGHVENCSCPVSYTGLSCELCDSGYRREHPGRPEPSNRFEGCVPCSCTNRSSECDPESGICRNCRLGSEGNHCERCQPNVDNRTDCTQCYPGYYGLEMPGFNGCEECDCVLGNTPYGNGSVCNMTSGQCECKPKITGRRCDRCHENAVNTSIGCVDCPECYRLLQSEVHLLRSKMTDLQTAVARLNNGQIGDLPFVQQLNNSIEQLRFLTRKADNSSGVERGLSEALMKMNQTLNDLEKALKDTMESGMHSLENDTVVVHTTTNSTKDVITLINRLIMQSYNILNGSVKAGLNEAEEFANFLSGKVSIIGTMANQSTFHAHEQNRSAEVIVSRVDTAGKLVKEAVELSAKAVEDHNNTTLVIEKLRANASTVNSFGQQLRSFADQLYNNATAILNRTTEVFDEIQGLSPDNSNTVKQLLSAATAASDNTTLLITRTETLSKRYANLTAEINRCRAIVEEVMVRVNTTDRAAGETLRKATSAHNQATAAIALADKTHSDAKEMLKILREFANQSRQAQALAEQALTRVSEANKTSMDSIALAQQVHSAVQRAVMYASQSLSMATRARDLSMSEYQNVSNIYTDASNLEGRAVSSKYKEGYLENIKQNTTTRRSSCQLFADSCKSNYTRNAQDARTSAAQAKTKSDLSNNNAKAARQTVNKLLSDISNLQTVNTTRLKELQVEITRLRTAFTNLDVQQINAELKGARDEQARYIIEYKQKVQDTRIQTQELKQLYESLKSVPCN